MWRNLRVNEDIIMENSEIRCKNASRSETCFRSEKCLTKMHLLLLTALVFCSLTTGKALKILKLDVPSLVDPRTESVTLRCEYDLGGGELYAVQWHKDGEEFFKYMPSMNPPGSVYDIENFYVDVQRSDSKKVTLLNNYHKGGMNLAGTYACEVSTEAPNFLTTYALANMSVAVPPKSPPALEGLRPYYEVGEVLRAECTSAPSHPPAVLTFLLNEKEVSKSLTRHLQNDGHVIGNFATTTRQGLTIILERHHFPGGSLTLACEAVLPGVPIIKTLRTEKTATLAANNQRLAQEAPKAGKARSIATSLSQSLYLFILVIFLLYKVHKLA
ncbi:uncharacterized protein LOC117173216 [Belonocnema kinseyi]|uniref:uncharacterized protein LOC117173216 n=1 Tax=Belonocnema kinseyi TaxID=2817044 RepID=UPI00143DBBA4|nr:uncharacterized protein LOC117173216 [Belonocnema kinseyi]